MITVRFDRRQGSLQSVEVTGHAGYARHGQDVVCASVTSAVQLVCNGITEVLGVSARVAVEESLIRLVLPQDSPKAAVDFLQALSLHLVLLEQDYPDYLQTTVTEV